jgi:hypothetical protein
MHGAMQMGPQLVPVGPVGTATFTTHLASPASAGAHVQLPPQPAVRLSAEEQQWRAAFEDDPSNWRFGLKGHPPAGKRWVYSHHFNYTLPVSTDLCTGRNVVAVREAFEAGNLMFRHVAGTAAQTLEAGIQVRESNSMQAQSLCGKAKIGEPTKFWGREGKQGKQAVQAVAHACEAFLLEMQHYLSLADVPPMGQPLVAATYLTGQAKQAYQARLAVAQAAGKPITWEFFQSTLHDLYVPPAQSADIMAKFMDNSWAPPVNSSWDVDTLLSKFDVATDECERAGLHLEPLHCAQQLLSALPQPARDLVRLNEAHHVQTTVGGVRDRLLQRRTEVEAAVHATAPKPVGKQGHPFVSNPLKVKGGGVSKPPTKAPAGPSSDPKGGKFMGTCFKCHEHGHKAADCPLLPKHEQGELVTPSKGSGKGGGKGGGKGKALAAAQVQGAGMEE